MFHPPPPALDAVERAVVRDVNAIRARHGLGRLRRSGPLIRAADAKAAEIARSSSFSHTSPDGTPADRRMRRYVAARTVGETLAAVPSGQPSQASAIVRLWMRSPPHRAVLLSSSFRRVGVGRRTGTLGGRRVALFALDVASAR